MDEKDEKWRIFEKTGSVTDYLHYRKARRKSENEFKNSGDGSKAEKSSQ